MIRIRQRAPVESRDERDKLQVSFRPARRRRNFANHPVRLFVVGLGLLETPGFLKQRRRVQNESLLDRSFLSDQAAVRKAVVQLQGQPRRPANTGKIRRHERGPFAEPRETRGTQILLRGQSLAPNSQGRSFSRHLRAILPQPRRSLLLHFRAPRRKGSFLEETSALHDHLIENREVVNFSQQVLQEFQIGRPTLIHRRQKIFHGVAKLLQAHAQAVVGEEAPAALRAAIQVANTFPDFENQGFASGAVGHDMAVMLRAFSSPGPPLLPVKFPDGRARIGPVLFVLFFQRPEEHIRRSLARKRQASRSIPSGLAYREASRAVEMCAAPISAWPSSRIPDRGPSLHRR